MDGRSLGDGADEQSAMADEFQQFVEECYRPAYLFAFSLCASHDEACDLTQQAFYVAQQRATKCAIRQSGGSGFHSPSPGISTPAPAGDRSSGNEYGIC
jgi:DNA-directed RNA polymerase specialized sigma24 family protein